MKTTLYTLLLLAAFVFSATAKAQSNKPLVFAPELGKKYILSTEISAVFTREATEERKAKNKSGNVVLTFSFVPKKINEKGNYEIECLLNRATLKSTKNGEVRESFDSDAVTADAKEGKNNRTVTALKETPLVFEVNKVGQMVGVTGIEAIDKKISEGDSTAGMQLIRDEKYFKVITTVIKSAFNHFTSFYSTKPMQVGDNWSVAMDTTMFKALRFPELKGEDNYTVNDNSNGVITVNGSSTFKFEKDKKDGMVSVVKESVIKIDAATGLVQNAKFVYTAAEPLTEEESKTKKPENVTFTITVAITPAN